MTADTALVIPLSTCRAPDLDLVGGKGANLGELIAAGLPVPDGFVITTAAYDAVIGGAGVPALATSGDPDGLRTLFETIEVPPALVDQIRAGYAALGEPAVAVRSSATTEDLPDASFAGQQDTFLNVQGADALLAATRRCWASLWGERALAYRAQHAADSAPRIAVVVQRLVVADVAGVMFTADPANGRRDQTVITAAWGLGEAVVGGLVEPDEFVLDRAAPDRDPGAALESTPEWPVRRRIAAKRVRTVTTAGGSEAQPTPPDLVGAPTLTDAQVRELAALGERVQAHFGRPQDIEWVLADGTFQLVQARPITALPEPTGDIPTEWPIPRADCLYFRASIVEQLPDPLTPLFADLIRPAVPAGLNALMTELSPRTAGLDVDFPTISGYAYYAYAKKALNRMWGITPSALRMLSRRNFVISRLRDRALPAYRSAVASWSGQDPARLSATALLTATRELLEAGCRYYTNVQMVIPVAATTELSWTGLYDAVLRGSDEAQASDFLLGFDSTPILAEKSLYRVADWCRGVPGLAEALNGLTAVPDEAPSGVSPSDWTRFRDRFGAHLSEYGHTLYNLDFANPVPADDPAPVLEALKHALSGRAADPVARQRALAERRSRITRELMDRLDPVRRKLARGSLAAAQHWAPIREDALAAMGLAWPTMRRLLAELGRRLVRAGAIAQPDQVYWLTSAEVDAAASALDAGTTTLRDQVALVEQRRMTWRGQALATPPQYLPEAGWVTLMDRFMPAHTGDQSGPVLKGTGGSGGRVTARARVLAGAEDFAAFQPGEILVASITTPAYTPLFALAAGVVTDIGGVLSHGSIVAREYGIPAVLGTGVATRRISTGDVISIDGGTGTVRLDGEPQDSSPAGHAVPAWAWVTGVAAASAGVVALVARRPRA